MSTQAFKRKLSGSSSGDGILVVETESPGTLIHTAIASVVAGVYDEIWAWAYNDSTGDVSLAIQFGGAEISQTINVNIPPQCGLVPIIPGLILQNSGTFKAYASEASVISIIGFVHALSNI